MQTLANFVAAVSNLVEAHTEDIRVQAQRAVVGCTLCVTVAVLFLAAAALLLAGLHHLLVAAVGVAGAYLVIGLIVLILALGVLLCTWATIGRARVRLR